MNLFINGSNREKNCYSILKDIMEEKDKLISLSHKDIKFCLGCNACLNNLEKYCAQNDYMTEIIYPELKQADKIILASPLYMSGITGLLKTVIDRFYAFYNHNFFEEKTIYLILTGQGTYEDNEEEINDIVKYFSGISEWINFDFKFLRYFCSGDQKTVDNVKVTEENYDEEIRLLKEVIKG